MKSMKKTCNSCVFAINGKTTCAIYKALINPDRDICPRHQSTVEICQVCGQVMLRGTGTYSQDLKIWACNECAPHLYTCATCKHRKEAPDCVMRQYQGPKPVLIKVNQRQGPFTLQSTQINPEVLDEVCLTCTCGSPYNCQKNHRCNNWECRL